VIGQPTGNSVLASGNVAAPGAAGVVASIPAGSLPAGTYHILAEAGYGAVAGAVDDVQLRAGATVLGTFRLAASIGANDFVNIEAVRVLDGLTAVSINAIAGAAGNYIGNLVVTPIRGA
jgi:hypothetical protein